jgi:peptide/nickel transport system substrate-binding protein
MHWSARSADKEAFMSISGGRRMALGLAIVLAAVWLVAPAWAGKKDDVLNIAWEKELETLNLYYQTAREGVILGRHIFDRLLYRDPESGEYKPALAKSFKWVDSRTMEFELRQGITFHNGETFDADDVVFTLNHVSNPDNKVKVYQYVSWIKSAEKLGPYKVRIHLKDPTPAALEFLSGPVMIYPDQYYQKVGMKEFGVAPVGTGPYKVAKVIPGKEIVLKKNESYFKESPNGQPTIGTIRQRTIPEANTKIAELMTGGLDWIWHIPKDQAEKLAQMPNITVVAGETMRVGFLYFLLDKPDVKTPFTDIRVRKAVAHAIDRAAIVKNLVGGASKVMHATCYPKQFGCTEEGVTRYEYDPAKAKKLLAEAGYPNGIDVDLHAYRDRPYAEAVVNYLRNVGIRANLQYMQYSALREIGRARKVPMAFWTWGSNSVYDISAFVGNWYNGTGDDVIRDPQVIEWITTGDTSIDPAVRKANYKKALQRITEQAYTVPLFTWVVNYAHSKELDFKPWSDEVPRFYMSKWK